MTSTASETPVNALVKINTAGAMSFPSCDLNMDKRALLVALANDVCFAEDFRRVSRTRCTVFVFWAATSTPSDKEVASQVELTEDVKIFEALPAKHKVKLFIHVLLPKVSGTLHVCD